MIKTGLCSVSFRRKTADEIIELTKRAKLSAIEWAGNAHVPEGDVALAEAVGKKTRDAGLEVSSYGSYFRLGMGQDIEPHLKTAKALGTNQIRIWAGFEPSSYITPLQRRILAAEAKEISRRAAEYGITLATELHHETITDTAQSALMFMFEVNEPNFKTYWQEDVRYPEADEDARMAAIYASGKLSNLHVFSLLMDGLHEKRLLLEEQKEKWARRLSVFKNDSEERFALIEFVKDDSEESFFKDAETLIESVKI